PIFLIKPISNESFRPDASTVGQATRRCKHAVVRYDGPTHGAYGSRQSRRTPCHTTSNGACEATRARPPAVKKYFAVAAPQRAAAPLASSAVIAEATVHPAPASATSPTFGVLSTSRSWPS